MVGLVYKRISMLSPFITLLRYIQPVNPTLTLINPKCMIGFIQEATQSFLCCAVLTVGFTSRQIFSPKTGAQLNQQIGVVCMAVSTTRPHIIKVAPLQEHKHNYFHEEQKCPLCPHVHSTDIRQNHKKGRNVKQLT